MFIIEVHQSWRYGKLGPFGRTPMLHAGAYRVPRDIPEELARRAIAAGVASTVTAAEPSKPAPEPKTPTAPAVTLTPRAGRLEIVSPRWSGATVVVAAPGPSLTAEVAERCKGFPTIAVQDACRLMPWADILYGCDAAWWDAHKGCPDFQGEKWSSHGSKAHNDKRPAARAYGLRLIAGKDAPGFSADASRVHYGSNSGFQAVNLALLFGARRIVLVGFDMRVVDGRRHFFGDHPSPLLNRTDYAAFITAFEKAAKSVPEGREIINATPGSALQCFRSLDLERALSETD